MTDRRMMPQRHAIDLPSPSFCTNLRLHHKVIRAVQWLLKMVQLRHDNQL